MLSSEKFDHENEIKLKIKDLEQKIATLRGPAQKERERLTMRLHEEQEKLKVKIVKERDSTRLSPKEKEEKKKEHATKLEQLKPKSKK